MADETPKSENGPGVAEKLKELEQNLAKELDIAVETSGVGGMSTGNSNVTSATIQTPKPPKNNDLEINPQIVNSPSATQPGLASGQPLQATAEGANGANLQAAESQESSNTSEAEDVSNASLDVNAMDEILYANNKELKGEIDGLEGELSKIKVEVNLESSALGDEFLKQDGEEDHPKPKVEPEAAPVQASGKPKVTLKEIIKTLIEVVIEFIKIGPAILSVISSIKGLAKKEPKAILELLTKILTPSLKSLQNKLKKLFSLLGAVRPRTYAEIIIAVLLVYGIRYWLDSGFRKFSETQDKDAYITDYLSVGKDVQQVENTDSEDIDNPAAHPEYSVFIKRLIANLKPEKNGRLPLAALEVYLEASNQETAIEIKDREKEIHHYIARAVETMTFEELDSAAGKMKLKLRIKIFVNPLLTKGRINRVYYKSLQVTQ